MRLQELQMSALSEVVSFVLSETLNPWIIADIDLRRLRDIAAGKKEKEADA